MACYRHEQDTLHAHFHEHHDDRGHGTYRILEGNNQMNIKGSGKGDSLHGQEANDVISGGKGNDFLWGHGGDDILTGGAGADVFVLSSGGGHDTITDFNPAAGDVIVFSYNTALDAMFIGPLSDGMAWTSDSGGNCWVKAGDFNGDGRMDTEVYVNDVSVTILGWAPEHLTGQMLLGG
jgi:Ca2+-binding RTX toxin-like protein